MLTSAEVWHWLWCAGPWRQQETQYILWPKPTKGKATQRVFTISAFIPLAQHTNAHCIDSFVYSYQCNSLYAQAIVCKTFKHSCRGIAQRPGQYHRIVIAWDMAGLWFNQRCSEKRLKCSISGGVPSEKDLEANQQRRIAIRLCWFRIITALSVILLFCPA